MPKRYTGESVFDAAVDRMVVLYEQGHRVVVSFSGGKDSTVCLEICIVAASLTNRLPVEVIMRDEEIMLPGTFEYCERVYQRPELDFHWIHAGQPITNIFNREQPYWWVFDDRLQPEEWVRQPPEYAYRIEEKNIISMTVPWRFPPAEGKSLYAVIGLRTQESRARLMGMFSSGSYITKPNKFGVRNVRPIYDWKDGDVWKAMQDHGWDYDSAYDVMARFGIPKNNCRIAPPTLTYHGVPLLAMASKAWPQWFDRVEQRLPGVRAAAFYGKRAVQPERRFGETWEQCFWRTCVAEAPQWIAERSNKIAEDYLRRHARHSTDPFPETKMCPRCGGKAIRNWKQMAQVMFGGDPMSLKTHLKYIEPEFFRQGAGVWDGPPAFQ